MTQTATLSDALTVAGATTLSSTLTMSGNGAVVSGTASGAQSLFATTTGALTIGGGAVTISAAGSATTVSGTLTVSEAATLSDALTVSGSTTLSSTLTMSGNGAVESGSTTSAQSLFATTTGTLTIGGGAVVIGTAGAVTLSASGKLGYFACSVWLPHLAESARHSSQI